METKTRLVEVHGKKLITTSLIVAEQFEKRHKNIIQKIENSFDSKNHEIISFARLNFQPSEYIDSSGKANKFYEMTEEGFAEVAMSLTGDKAKLVRIRILNEFKRIQRQLKDPNRKIKVQEKKDAHKSMMNTLKEVRMDIGKKTEAKHFLTESKLCNWVITGKFQKIDENDLSAEDIDLLAQVRKRNEAFLLAGIDYTERKKRLHEFGLRFRTKQIEVIK